MTTDQKVSTQNRLDPDGDAKRVLVVDDEPQLRALVQRILVKAGYSVQSAQSAQECLDLIDVFQPHLIILDIRMPGMDGIATCRRIRRFSSVPIIFLSVDDAESSILRGFDCGAMDYILKPFRPRILLARVKWVLEVGELIDATRAPQLYKDDYLEIDVSGRRVTVQGEPIHLTALESAVLLFLVRHRETACSIQTILEAVWSDEHEGATSHVYTYIRRLRSKLERDPKSPEYIVNVHGAGYRFQGR